MTMEMADEGRAAENPPHFFDSHSHYHRALLQTPPPPPLVRGVVHCPMAIDETDWPHMSALLDRDDVAVAGAGLHPWFAHRKSADWAARLVSVLESDPRLIVGEIGLDRVARTPDTGQVEWSEQLSVFEQQMAMAAHLRRPVSMHCVKAHGPLFDWLRKRGPEQLPPALAMHSWTGSPEMAKAFLGLKGSEVFFGFSAAINMKTDHMAGKMRDVLQHVPLSRVLLESDLEDGQGLEQGLRRACHAIAQAYNQQQHEGAEGGGSGAAAAGGGGGALTAADVARVTEDNARRFFFQSRAAEQQQQSKA